MNLTRKPKAVIFDAFGTLCHFDHTPGHPKTPSAYQELRDKSKISPEIQQRAKKYIMTHNISRSELCTVLSNMGTSIPFPITQDLRTSIENEVKRMAWYAETVKTLSEVYQRGYPLAIASNLAQPYGENLRSMIQKDLASCFEDKQLIFSYEVGTTKPFDKIYSIAADAVGFPYEDIIMVGDNPKYDAQKPESLGMQGVHLKRNTNSKIICKNTISNLSELLTILP